MFRLLSTVILDESHNNLFIISELFGPDSLSVWMLLSFVSLHLPHFAHPV